MSYNFKDFDTQFPDDAACLDHIFRARFANHVCECGKSKCFHRIAKRRTYCCAWCGAMISPKYLQSYLNEFSWRYCHRYDSELFASLVAKTGLTPAKAAEKTEI